MYFNGAAPSYYNTFVQPMQPVQQTQSQTGNAGGTGITTSGSLNGSGPTQQPQQQQGQSGSLPLFTSGMNDTDVRNLINRYAAQAGTTNADNGDYFLQKYHEFGSSDPNYFMTRLANGIVNDAHGNPNAFQGTGISYGAGTAGGPGWSDNGNNQQSGVQQGMQQQNDPNAWRRQNAMRQMQRPNYSGGSPYSMYNTPYGQSGYGSGSMYGSNLGGQYGYNLQGSSPSYQSSGIMYGDQPTYGGVSNTGYSSIPGMGQNSALNKPY